MSDISQTLEQKLLRLQEIQKLLEGGSINLTNSITMFEEANILKGEIESELNIIKSKITEIEARNNNTQDNDLNL